MHELEYQCRILHAFIALLKIKHLIVCNQKRYLMTRVVTKTNPKRSAMVGTRAVLTQAPRTGIDKYIATKKCLFLCCFFFRVCFATQKYDANLHSVSIWWSVGLVPPPGLAPELFC